MLPLVVFVCRDEDSAREFCRAADPVVRACHSYTGEYRGSGMRMAWMNRIVQP